MKLRVASGAVVGLAALALTVPAGATPGANAAGSRWRVVADHLNNPRQMAVDKNGIVYVAEAGRGGPNCMGSGQNQTCVGFTSAIGRIANGSFNVVVRGFISGGGPDGSFSEGADAVGVADGWLFSAMPSVGQKTPPGFPQGAASQLNNLLMAPTAPWPNNNKSVVANVSNDYYNNPPPQTIPPGDTSNPYGVYAVSKDLQYVTDAAANTLLEVRNGHVRRIFVFPNPNSKADAVPTSITRGPDGAFYIGELTGDAAPAGAAKVWRWMPGSKPTVWAGGFTNITGLSFGPDGSLYVAEFAAKNFAPNSGAVIRVDRKGNRTTLGSGVLSYVGGVAAVGGHVYVSNWSVCADSEPAQGPCGGHTGEIIDLTA